MPLLLQNYKSLQTQELLIKISNIYESKIYPTICRQIIFLIGIKNLIFII